MDVTKATPSSWKILLIDDDEDDYLLTRAMLSETRSGRVTLDWASNLPAGLETLKAQNYDAVLVDYDLGPHSGLELIRQANESNHPAAMILFTGRGSYEVDVEAMQAGATLYLTKGEVNPLLLERSIRYAIERKQAEEALLHANQELKRLNEELQHELARREQAEQSMTASHAALKESEERFRSVFEGMTEGFALHQIILDDEGKPVNYRFLEINPSFERLTGLKREQVVGHTIKEILPDDDPYWIQIYGEVALTGKPIHFENYSSALKQHYEVYSFRPTPGQFAVLFLNITERKQMEEMLRVNLTKYSVLFDSFPLGITVSDITGRVIETNQEAVRLLGISRDEHTSRQIDGQEWRIIRIDGSPMLAEEYASVRALKENRRVENVEMGIVKPGGLVTWISVTATPIPLEGYGVVVTYGDITDRKRAEGIAQEYARKLEESNHALEQFAFLASHDLQEPLRKIELFSQQVKKKAGNCLQETEREYLERIEAAASRMRKMVEDLLLLSRINTQGQPFERVDLNTTVEAVLDDLEVLIQKTGGQVEAEELPTVWADPTQMHVLLQNLISNGLKFHKPQVSPVVRVSASVKAGEAVEVCLQDNGIGFPEEKADLLFEPFERLHRRSEFEGSGIGLAICRKIVERHGGTISGRNRADEGSCFCFTLPL